MKKTYKRISQALKNLAENVDGINTVPDEERKERVQKISNELFDLTEILHDVDLVIDEVSGDDVLRLDPEDFIEHFEDDCELATGAVLNFEKNLKNVHKTFYDKNANDDLKLLAFEDFSRNWKTLDKSLNRILGRVNAIIKALATQ